MKCQVDATTIGNIDQMVGEDEEETAQLKQMLIEAKAYVESFEWFTEIVDVYFGLGIGGVVAVFLFELRRPVDECIWVIVGDLPAAYLVPDHAPDPVAALSAYCSMMRDWIKAVHGGTPLDSVFPVRATGDKKHATMLESRLLFIESKIIPAYSGD